MERERTCKKCSQNVDATTNPYTVCEGDCAGFYHAACVGLSDEDLSALSLNIIWMCDTCMESFRRARDNVTSVPTRSPTSAKPLEEEIMELKTTVAGIVETLSKLAPTTSSSDLALFHSTPISSYKLFTGTDACVSNTESDERHLTDDHDDDNFTLFITNINECATERDIRVMVSRALCTPEPERIEVIKLTSKWKHRMKSDFISFKVAFNKQWKTRAMDPSIWPKNVKFREFIAKQNETWSPV